MGIRRVLNRGKVPIGQSDSGRVGIVLARISHLEVNISINQGDGEPEEPEGSCRYRDKQGGVSYGGLFFLNKCIHFLFP